MAAETAIIIAHATGRVLVLPPETRWYLLDKVLLLRSECFERLIVTSSLILRFRMISKRTTSHILANILTYPRFYYFIRNFYANVIILFSQDYGKPGHNFNE
jgi:hypothetical protein